MYKVLHVNKHKHEYGSQLIMINERLPEFSLPTLANLYVKVNQDIFKDNINLINIWSSNCRACRQENVVLMKIASYIKSKKINLIGLNNIDDQERAETWLNVHGNPYNINLFDQKGNLALDLGVKSLPELFIVDSNKNIRYRYSGVITTLDWKTQILPVLEQLYMETNK